MGLLDFFKKGKEQPIEQRPQAKPASDVQRPAQPTSTTGTSQPGATSRRDYTIQSGDSLSKIAQKFYGNAADWQKIYNANKDLIKNPDKIFPGQKIVIP
jgi:nucleoid-associated protein YgaU